MRRQDLRGDAVLDRRERDEHVLVPYRFAVEKNFDFVTVTDAAGNVIAQVTGTFRRGYTTPCISTSVSNVTLAPDGSVVGQGFIVDAAVPCG